MGVSQGCPGGGRLLAQGGLAAPWAGRGLTLPGLCWQCSVTCGKGYRQRLVSCSEVFAGQDSYEYTYHASASCPGAQPPSVQPCHLGDCPVSAAWRVGNWGSVSRWPVTTSAAPARPTVLRPAVLSGHSQQRGPRGSTRASLASDRAPRAWKPLGLELNPGGHLPGQCELYNSRFPHLYSG